MSIRRKPATSKGAAMKYVRVEDGVVMGTWTEIPVLHPDLMAMVHEAPDEGEQRWTFDGTTFSAPVFVPHPNAIAAALDPSPTSVGLTGTFLETMEANNVGT